MDNEFSDYIIFVDESGDHGLKNINKDYPIFVLTFCIFNIDNYIKATTNLQKLKFKYFGHDTIVLHESEIRRNKKEFTSFYKEIKDNFLKDVTNMVEDECFSIISIVINKYDLLDSNMNVYHDSMKWGLAQISNYFTFNGAKPYIIFESRGKKEDKELSEEFNNFGCSDYFIIKIIDKKANEAGLQIADLIARPIGLSVLKPKQKNRAMEILKKKYFKLTVVQNKKP
jgi:hypothetical protein